MHNHKNSHEQEKNQQCAHYSKSCYSLMVSFFIILFFTQSIASEQCGVTNLTKAGSRFGDHLLGYCKAKWVAFQHNMPFYLKPFSYSNELILSQKETTFSAQITQKYKNKIHIQTEPTKWEQNKDTLYYVNFYSKNVNWSITNPDSLFARFREELRTMIFPKTKPETPNIPPNMISIAVHVRKGGGYDPPLLSRSHYADQRWTLKLPPNRFYVEQIRYLYNYFGQQPLYVYIFTDDKKPNEIVKTFTDLLADCQLHFDCRKTTNSHNMHVVDDLIGLSLFDCLIRPNSNFSICAQLIGKHKVIIWPTSYHWEETTLIIDEVRVHIP